MISNPGEKLQWSRAKIVLWWSLLGWSTAECWRTNNNNCGALVPCCCETCPLDAGAFAVSEYTPNTITHTNNFAPSWLADVHNVISSFSYMWTWWCCAGGGGSGGGSRRCCFSYGALRFVTLSNWFNQRKTRFLCGCHARAPRRPIQTYILQACRFSFDTILWGNCSYLYHYAARRSVLPAKGRRGRTSERVFLSLAQLNSTLRTESLFMSPWDYLQTGDVSGWKESKRPSRPSFPSEYCFVETLGKEIYFLTRVFQKKLFGKEIRGKCGQPSSFMGRAGCINHPLCRRFTVL